VGPQRPLRTLTTEEGGDQPEAGSPRPSYKGEPLDAARGPGLGCFWLQIAVLAVFVVITPIGALNGWPIEITAALLIATLVLTFFAGQTVIFLLRLVAADRRSRRRPIASRTRTVGELEDEDTESRPSS
jgi:hypothetical protein